MSGLPPNEPESVGQENAAGALVFPFGTAGHASHARGAAAFLADRFGR
jgi:hypothetical protein